VLAGHPDAIVAAVCDAQADVAGAMAAATGSTAYADWEAMFEAEPLDGAFVCTPPAVHLGPARAAFERGVPVYLEKPLARSLDETFGDLINGDRKSSVVSVGRVERVCV
jgi:predicted dehydrogenase